MKSTSNTSVEPVSLIKWIPFLHTYFRLDLKADKQQLTEFKLDLNMTKTQNRAQVVKGELHEGQVVFPNEGHIDREVKNHFQISVATTEPHSPLSRQNDAE